MSDQTKKTGWFRIYVFATVAVTLFLVGLIFLRTPIDGFVAETVIEVDGDVFDEASTSVPSASELQSAITADEVLASVFPSSSDDRLLEKVNVIWVSRLDVPKTPGHRFRISHMGETRSNAKEVAELLTQEALSHVQSQVKTSAKPETATGKLSKLKKAIKDETQAWRNFDQSVATSFQNLVEEVESFEKIVASPDPVPTTTTKATSEKVTVRNPEWEKLNNEVSQLSQRSHDLLTRFTPEHPEVKHLAIQINQARLALANTPTTVEVNEEPDLEFSAEPEPILSSHETDEVQMEKVKAAVVAAARNYQQLQSNYETSRLTPNSVADEIQSVQVEASPARQVATIIQPARIIRREGGLPSRMFILVILGLSLAVAAIASLLARGKVRPVYRNAKQVEQELTIPIAATVAVAQVRGDPNKGFQLGQAVQWFTNSCEVILAVIVIALLFFALTDSPTFDSFASDPFGTISETVARAQKFQI